MCKNGELDSYKKNGELDLTYVTIFYTLYMDMDNNKLHKYKNIN